MSNVPTHSVHAPLPLRVALELLARHANPPHQPEVHPVDVAGLLGDTPLDLSQVDLRGANLRGLQLGKPRWPPDKWLTGCESEGAQPQPPGLVSFTPGQPHIPPVLTPGHLGSINALAVLPDGHFLSAGDDRTVRLWSSKGGEALAEFSGHERVVHALAVLPKGCFLSAGIDGTIRRWNPEAGVCDALWSARDGLTLYADPDGMRFTRDGNAPWQTMQHNGHKLPCDPLLYGHTRFVDANGRTQPAYRYPELLVWENDDRTLRVQWPEGYDWQTRLGGRRSEHA